MIDVGTRKHGPFDPRYPRPRARMANPGIEPSVDRESLDAWEGEGGQVASRTRADGRGRDHRRPEPATLPDGLSWSSFCALVFPGMKRHYFPAIASWYEYRDRDRSQPGAPEPTAAGAPSAPRPIAPPPGRKAQPVKRVKPAAPRPARRGQWHGRTG